jgi:hypothetical protein
MSIFLASINHFLGALMKSIITPRWTAPDKGRPADNTDLQGSDSSNGFWHSKSLVSRVLFMLIQGLAVAAFIVGASVSAFGESERR